MKTRILTLLFIASAGLPTGCYEDKSKPHDGYIPEIVIDTTGIATILPVKQFGRLAIAPAVSREGADEGDFSYKWMLNRIPLSDPTNANAAVNQYMLIGEQMELDAEIPLAPNPETYFLWYQVTDNTTGLRKDILWNVRVEQMFGEGLLVAQTYDGETTDLSYVEAPEVKEGFTGDPVIIHNIYSRQNGTTFDGLMTGMCSAYNTALMQRRLYCITGDNYALIEGEQYGLVGTGAEVMFDKNIPLRPTQIFVCPSETIVLVTDGKLYPFFWSNEFDNPGLALPTNYTSRTQNKTVNYSVDKTVAYTPYPRYWGRTACLAVIYDKANEAFLYATTSISNETKTFLTYTQTSPFNPNVAPGLETQWGGTGLNGQQYMLMKNTVSEQYEIYVFTTGSTKAPQARHIVPAGAKLDEAVGYEIAHNARVVYFATKSEVYAIITGAAGSAPEVKQVYSVPSGEITSFSMFRQAWYLQQPDSRDDANYEPGVMSTHEKLLLIGVSSGNTGEVHTLPITDPATATVDTGAKQVYTGFGRILTMTTQQ